MGGGLLTATDCTRGECVRSKDRILIIGEDGTSVDAARTGVLKLAGETVLERSEGMWYSGRALFASAKRGNLATRVSCGLTSTAYLLRPPIDRVLSSLSSLHSCLQNALRRLFLSMTSYSNPPLPPSFQPVAAQVPRGPP